MAREHLRHDPELEAKATEIELLLERQWNDPREKARRERIAEIRRLEVIEGNKRLKDVTLGGGRGREAREWAVKFWAEHKESEFTLELFRRQLAEAIRGWNARDRAAKARAPR